MKIIVMFVTLCAASIASAGEYRGCINDDDLFKIALCVCYNTNANDERLECYDNVFLKELQMDAIASAKRRIEAQKAYGVDVTEELLNGSSE